MNPYELLNSRAGVSKDVLASFLKKSEVIEGVYKEEMDSFLKKIEENKKIKKSFIEKNVKNYRENGRNCIENQKESEFIQKKEELLLKKEEISEFNEKNNENYEEKCDNLIEKEENIITMNDLIEKALEKPKEINETNILSKNPEESLIKSHEELIISQKNDEKPQKSLNNLEDNDKKTTPNKKILINSDKKNERYNSLIASSTLIPSIITKRKSESPLKSAEPSNSSHNLNAKIDIPIKNSLISEPQISDIHQKKPLESEKPQEIFTKASNLLKEGVSFWKYGRKDLFRPQKRKILFSENLTRFYWGKSKKQKNFTLDEILEIRYGRNTENFIRFGVGNREKNKLCFSIVTRNRSIDLQALNLKEKEGFLEALNQIMTLKKKPYSYQ